ncbi:MAG: hypothetical protein ACRCU2_13200, partial [Planktothrix sp.]
IKRDLKATPTQATPTQATAIKDYNDFRGIYSSLIDANIIIPVYNLKFEPWKEWNNPPDPADINNEKPSRDNDNPPQWWTYHNKIKHHRISSIPTKENKYYKAATLYNALSSVAGLMCLLFHYYPEIQPSGSGAPLILQPKLFDANKSGRTNNIKWTLDL